MPTVLLIDDAPIIIDMLTLLLRRYGYGVAVLRDGLKLIETLRQTQPALVLMDISLPIKDGWTLIKEIRLTPDVAHIPVIAVSGHCDDANKSQMVLAGYNDALCKPFDMQDLVQKVRFYVGQVRMCA